MNLLTTLTIFVFVLETVWSTLYRIGLFDDRPYAPLALIKKHNSRLELAIPQKSNKIAEYAYYSHDESEDENGSVDKFFFACPARFNSDEHAIEEKWKKDNNMPEYSRLFILRDLSSGSKMCSSNVTPSIEKAQKKSENGDIEYCGDSEAEIYNVGFPVSNNDGTDMQFVSIYKICHSTAEGKGTLYSIHRIASPSFLLQKVWEYYKPNTEKLYACILDNSYSSEQMLYQKQYAYQFVGIQDMPTEGWGSTTQFSFNYTPITLNHNAMKGMIAVDNYIRLYSRETNKPLTLYSGVYQTTVNKAPIPCLSALCNEPTPIVLNSFWRIIKDDEGLAIIAVTQHTEMKCVEDGFICHDGRVMVKEYKKGGCTYLCSVTDGVIEQLRLPRDELNEFPPLKIGKDLELTFPRKKQSPSKYSKERANIDGQLPEKVSISDFFGKADFKSALMKADPNLASIVRVHKRGTADGRRDNQGYGPVYNPADQSGKTGGGPFPFLGA